MTTGAETLFLPALKAHMGDWNYYIAFIRFDDVVRRVRAAEDIHTAASLRDLLQRGLRNRAPEIAEYLRHQGQRFFNAIVVGTYGGHSQWRELEVKVPAKTQLDLPQHLEGALGFLVLDGSETLFAIDGQHRIAGIAKAIEEQPALASEELPAIFVKGVTQAKRERDPQGFERTRRLFTTLNSRGKPVGKRDIIALDEDDAVAIVTRQLVEEHPLFKNKVDTRGARSIHPSNRVDLTTIITLYDALDSYFIDRVKALPGKKRRRPGDNELSRFHRDASRLYMALARTFPPIAHMRDSAPEDHVASQYRSRHGGHLLFRPIGFLMIHRVLRRLLQHQYTQRQALDLVARAPMDLAEAPWRGLLWDETNERMITAPENQRVAERLLYRGLGQDLGDYRTTDEALVEEWAGLVNREPSELRLPRFRRRRSRAPG